MSTEQHSQQNQLQNCSSKFKEGDLVKITQAYYSEYEIEHPERAAKFRDQYAVVMEGYCGFDENEDTTITALCKIFIQNTAEYLEWREDWLEKV
jgi:hypothetical protein